MAFKLSDKELFIIHAAWHRLNEEKYDVSQGWKRVKRVTQLRKRRRIYRYAAAVAFLGLIVGYTGWWYQSGGGEIPADRGIQRAKGVPVLTLANGSQVMLDKKNSCKEIPQSGARVVVHDNMFSLSYIEDTLKEAEKESAYNTLTIPKGGEYALTLADGSKVWLNAESVLRFPVHFTGMAREVELEGEAYFEVKADSLHPFRVRMDQTSVEVLGTRFNVSSYPGDRVWHTTLVEGKVKIHQGANSYLLAPGNQYQENRLTGTVELKPVNVSLYTSWKDGKVVFLDEKLEDIIEKLARWYDFEIYYANPEIKNLRFGGAINKYNSFNVVLRYLEQTSGVRFDIDGKTVIASASERVV